MPKNRRSKIQRRKQCTKRAQVRRPTGPKPKRIKFADEKHKAFANALRSEMAKHGDTIKSLLAALDPNEYNRRRSCVQQWRLGRARPMHKSSFSFLRKVEERYNLPDGYFESLLYRNELSSRKAIKLVNPTEQAAFRWHLPANFDDRSPEEQAEIQDWIKRNVLPAGSEYGKYQSTKGRNHYAVVFPTLPPGIGQRHAWGFIAKRAREVGISGAHGTIDAPKRLAQEMADFVECKTALLPPKGHRRIRRWSVATARQQTQRYGQILGALVASPLSAACGKGVSKDKLTLGLLVFPGVLDWYLQWRQNRRGFFTSSERSDLYEIKSACRYSIGWIRQRPELARRLKPIPGLVTAQEIAEAKRDWAGANDVMFKHCSERVSEIQHSYRAHRDPFAAIAPILDAQSPLAEYKKIADEILKHMPDRKSQPIQAALSVRSYLMVRFALHLGFRQRNLRELLICPKGQPQRTAETLQGMRCGELRWNGDLRVWQVFMPALAFKNGHSSYFKGRPHQANLPNLDSLYAWIEEYVKRHRPALLKSAADPGTFFIKETGKNTRSASYDCFSFYDAWMMITQKYGIYNPYTKKGAIKDLRPHGPHSIRDVLATHVLKQTGSYELAGFAIQDTTTAVMRHYARFLPNEKAAKAAEVLNRTWKASKK